MVLAMYLIDVSRYFAMHVGSWVRVRCQSNFKGQQLKIFVSCSSRKPGLDFSGLPTATRFQRSNVNAGQQESTQVIQKQ